MNEISIPKNFKTQKILFSILIIIFSLGLVVKTFQNDTFFNISIGKYILENGIDMKEHFSWTEGLDYTYSHWAFDVVIYLLYNISGYTGIYIGLLILTAITNVVLFNLISNRTKTPFIALVVTLFIAFLSKECYAARSQITSFICFIIEIYCIEQFIDTNKKRYAISIIILSIVIANFHAATWPLVLVLFLPYFAPAVLNSLSARSIYLVCAKYYEKKYYKYKDTNPEKAEGYKKDFNDYTKFANEKTRNTNNKIIRKDNYNAKRLLILFITVCFTGLLTPIHGVPYTYIIKSMLGKSNFPNNSSIDFISEMQPLVLVSFIPMILFIITFITLLTFMPTKIKSEHGFLILGLTLMAFMSKRYTFLLILLGSYVIADLLSQAILNNASDDYEKIKNIRITPFVFVISLILVSTFSISMLVTQKSVNYVDETAYPVGATQFILDNLDYKNIKIYNSYNNGSYLMLNNIKVFIDSRLDVYCSEFADTDIFKDYIESSNGSTYYKDVFNKYQFTHILLKNNTLIDVYIKYDDDYKEIYSDDYYTLYEKV